MESQRRNMIFKLNSSFDGIFAHQRSSIIHKLPGNKQSLTEIDENYLITVCTQLSNRKIEITNTIELLNKEKDDDYNQIINGNINNDYLLESNNEEMEFNRKCSIEFMSNLWTLGTKAENEEKDPLVYSMTAHHPFSYFYGNKTYCFNKKGLLIVPAPMFISSDEWMKRPDLSKEGILNGTRIDGGGLVLIDPVEMKKFKGIVGNMIKQILLAALGTKISLLVRLFEPKCLTHRISDFWSFSNYFLKKAALKSLTPLDRMKLVIAMSISGLYIPTKQLKPFNPYLGETFQGEYESGTKVYVEHMSHHPLVSRFLVQEKEYIISGWFNFIVRPESLGSIINAYEKGPINVTFPEIGEEIIYHMPNIRVGNATNELNRTSLWAASMGYIDKKNGLRAVIKFCQNKKKLHEIKGCIFQHDFTEGYHFVHDKESEYEKKTNVESMINDMGKNTKYKVLGKITGSWLENLLINDQEIWNINKDIPEWIRPVKRAIPSDGRFREDVIWLYRAFHSAKNEAEVKKYEDISQQWKIMMEKFQRVERDLRMKYLKK